jgi:tetratricopeptide (TPR) repeat protein
MLTYALTLWLLCPVPAAPAGTPKAKAKAKATKRTTPKAKQTVRLGPMLFSVKGGKVKRIEQLDIKELFRLGSQMYQAKRYPVAIRLYKRIIKYFPKHKHIYAAWYNLALAQEDSKQYKQAITAYQAVIKLQPKRANVLLNARFRLAACHNHVKQWKQAFDVYDALLQGNLSTKDRIDALAYAGRALFHLNQFPQAQPLLRLAVMSYKQLSQKGPHYAAAMAQYYWAQIHDKKFRSRSFKLPQKQLKKDLDYKSIHLLKAQKLYFRTIRIRHADWALAALYRIGDMYETMYQSMMKAPIPKDLKAEEIRIYQQLLRDKIKVLLAKALLAYQMNLKLADIVGLKGHKCRSRSKQRFAELLQFYQKSFGKSPALLKGKLPTSQPTAKRPAPRTQVPVRPAPRAPVAKRPAPRKPTTAKPTAKPTSRPATRK